MEHHNKNKDKSQYDPAVLTEVEVRDQVRNCRLESDGGGVWGRDDQLEAP